MATGFPAPSFVQIPENGIINGNAVLGQLLYGTGMYFFVYVLCMLW